MASAHFTTRVVKKHSRLKARILEITTPHGQVMTPAFMPVGTKAAVSAMMPEDLIASGSQIILGGNTYHMLVSPGLDIIRSAGGMHEFMNWHKPMLTDSGGFQVFSLSRNGDLCRIDDGGATFKHAEAGQWVRLTSESSIAAQKAIGADIIMAFDYCTADSVDHDFVERAMTMTHRWLLSSVAAHAKDTRSSYGHEQAIFGIIQGGGFRDLRERSASFVTAQDVDGVALGGETIGFNMPMTIEILNWIEPLLPANKVRYTMGVGAHPQDLFDVIAHGVDIFDCVAPTRNARHGTVFCGRIAPRDGWFVFESDYRRGVINLEKSKFADDDRPIMADCACHTCSHHSRAYLNYLLKTKTLDYFQLASIHNIAVMHEVCRTARDSIMAS